VRTASRPVHSSVHRTRRTSMAQNATATVPYSQSKRPLGVTTPLGTDALLLETFTGEEALSQPFVFRLDLLALKATAVPFEKLLGQQATVRLDLPSTSDATKSRYFNGVI